MKEKNPLSPHIQIYSWHISSIISISHRITGIINIILITFICFWVALLLLGDTNYELIQKFFQTFFGKFLIVGTVWSFSFQILSEIRHLFWDLGLGFELKTSKLTGLIVIFGSFFLTILVFILGKNLVL
jgi:succinate dehydrogenase, cytochrome b556 subunit